VAWDTPSVNRGRRAQAGPVRKVSFGEIARRMVAAFLVALVFGWAASWAVPAPGETARRLAELGVGALGFALALWLQWRPRRHGLPQRVLDGADRRWIGGRQYDPEPGDHVVGEGLAEVAIDVVINVVSDIATD